MINKWRDLVLILVLFSFSGGVFAQKVPSGSVNFVVTDGGKTKVTGVLNKLRWDPVNNRLGINQSSNPTSTLHVSGTVNATAITGSASGLTGVPAQKFTGSPDITYDGGSVAVRSESAASSGKFLVNGSSGAGFFVADNGNVGIKTDSPAATFQVGENGDGTVAKGNVWTAYSDKRLKLGITAIEDGLSKLKSLRGVSFTWKKSGKRDIGVIAQEVEAVFPELVSTNESGMKTVNYGALSAVALAGLNDMSDTQDQRLSRVHNDLNSVATKLQEINHRLADLERQSDRF